VRSPTSSFTGPSFGCLPRCTPPDRGLAAALVALRPSFGCQCAGALHGARNSCRVVSAAAPLMRSTVLWCRCWRAPTGRGLHRVCFRALVGSPGPSFAPWCRCLSATGPRFAPRLPLHWRRNGAASWLPPSAPEPHAAPWCRCLSATAPEPHGRAADAFHRLKDRALAPNRARGSRRWWPLMRSTGPRSRRPLAPLPRR